MKKFILSTILGILYLSTFGQSKFTIEIKSRSLVGENICLEIYNNKNYVPVISDSVILMNGQAIFHGIVTQHSSFASILMLHEGKHLSVRFMVDSGLNVVNLDLPAANSRILQLTSNARGQFIL